MTKSSLCTYSNITGNRSHGRGGNRVCKVTPHYMVAQWTGKQCADYFASTSRQASSNYCIGIGGDIAMSVDEDDRAWTSGSGWNDRQAITIECANNPDSSLTDATYSALVKLCADVCARYGITPSYDGTKNATFTEHRMFQSTDCPGSWLHAHMGQLVADVKAAMGGGAVSVPASGGSASVDGDVTDLARRVIAGEFGNGEARKAALGSRYAEVQAEVNRMLSGGSGANSSSGASGDVDDLARRVIAGDFGNGDARKAALGDKYAAVQARVNEMLGAGSSGSGGGSGVDIDALARAVIRGDYGNGDERKRRLGTNYAAVQARVNQMLA